MWPFLPGQRVTQICASGDRAFLLMHNGDLYRWDNLREGAADNNARSTAASTAMSPGSRAGVIIYHRGCCTLNPVPERCMCVCVCTARLIVSVCVACRHVGTGSTPRSHRRRAQQRGENERSRGYYVIPTLVPIHDLMVKRALKPAWKALNIACGPRHVLCTTDVGQVFSWGSGGDGRLGHGDTESVSDPKVSVLRVVGWVVAWSL